MNIQELEKQFAKHENEIMRQVDVGTLTIADAD